MSDYTPTVPIEIQIRKVIFDKFNNVDSKFTNDDIFEILVSGKDIDPSWIIDDIEPFINKLCESGLARNIAQNFTTIWLKLFDTMKMVHCKSCGLDVHLSNAEDMKCPNASCNSML